MRKQGFTLVELLAVIAILAILVIIALPNVMGMFNEAKKNSFTTEVKEIYKVAEQQWMNDSMLSTSEQIYRRCPSCSGKSLQLTGRNELEYYIKFDKSGKVVKYYATDHTYQYRYDGEGLRVEEISGVEAIADITNEANIVVISDPKVEVVIRYYKVTGSSNVCNVMTKDETCYEGQTIEECIGKYFNEGNWNIRVYHTRTPGLFGGYSYDIVNIDQPVSLDYNSAYANIYCQCLSGETEIFVYDKKKKKRLKKKLKDISYNDLVLVWNFDKGCLDWALPVWIMKPVLCDKKLVLTFEDGTKLNVVGDHRIFNCELNKFTSCLSDETFIGMHTINSNGNKIKLLSKEIINEKGYAYNIISEEHINVFANNLLTSQGSNNIYEIKDMKFVKNDRERFDDKDLKGIDKKYVSGLRLGEWITDEKGSKKETLKDMKEYIKSLEDKKM